MPYSSTTCTSADTTLAMLTADEASCLRQHYRMTIMASHTVMLESTDTYQPMVTDEKIAGQHDI